MNKYFQVELNNQSKLLVPLNNISGAISIDKKMICRVPGVPPIIMGIFEYQSDLLWLLDLNQILKLGCKDCYIAGNKLSIIVLSNFSDDSVKRSRQRIGCLASKLVGFQAFDSKQIELLPEQFFLSSQLSSQAGKVGESLISILKVNEVFSNILELFYCDINSW